jgi:hypothetical protein
MSAFPAADEHSVPVFARIYGLRPGTAYELRLVAVGEGGTGVGASQALTTLPPYAFAEEGSSGVESSTSRVLPAATVAALIAKQLPPSGRLAKLGKLLKSGGLNMRLKAPEAGTAVIDWYYTPRRAKGARRAARPVLVASGRLSFHSASTETVRMRLTAAGRRVLAGVTRIGLTARCTFTPRGGSSVVVSRGFELKR